MCKLIVGEPFAGPIPRGRETAFLKLNEGGGFTIYAFLTEMTVGEAKNIRQAPMQFKVIQEDDFVHTLVRFGPIAYELPFNPNHYSKDSLQDLFKSNMVTVIAIDSQRALINVIRYASLPLSLWSIYEKSWPAILANNEGYEQWLDAIENSFVYDLWERARYVGNGQDVGKKGEDKTKAVVTPIKRFDLYTVKTSPSVDLYIAEWHFQESLKRHQSGDYGIQAVGAWEQNNKILQQRQYRPRFNFITSCYDFIAPAGDEPFMYTICTDFNDKVTEVKLYDEW